jgi:hypothetical protein
MFIFVAFDQSPHRFSYQRREKLHEKHGKVCRSWKRGAERNTMQAGEMWLVRF